MHVLVIEPDQNFRLFLRRSIESDGHQVVAVARHSEGITAVRTGGVDTVLVGLEPGDTEVAEALHAIRAAAGHVPLQALLYSAFYEASDPELRDLLRLFARCQFLPKPFTTADLRDRLGRLLGGGPVTLGPLATGPYARPPTAVGDTLAPSPPRSAKSHEEMPALAPPRQAATHARVEGATPYRPPDLRNALILNRIWATRLTGVAALNGGPDGAHGWATVARGGPADPESKALLEAALYGGDLTFEATQVNATGDWEALGSFLFHGLRDPSQGRFAQENRFQALHRTAASHLALHLPIGLATRRLIARADGQTTLGELLAREGIDPAEVSHELHVLRLLRQVELQEPVAPPPRRELPVEAAPSGQATSFGTASTTSGGAMRPPRTPSVQPSRSVTNSGVNRPDSMSRSIGGASAVVQAPRSRPIIPPASGHSQSTTRSAMPGLNSVQRGSASVTGTASATLLGSGREQIANTLRRLTREAHDLAAAEPAVVLGIPLSADAELVRQAAERQRLRYTAMSRDPSLPAEARQLAKQILDRVDDAERGFARSRAQSTPKVDEEMLLTFARDLIGKRNWDQAEKALRKARQLRPDHAAVLANLGWTILCNPSRSAEQRTDEARELLLLAEQFDPNNADGQYYLAELLYRLGEYAAALPRAERAIKSQPDLVAATTLARRLRVKLTGGN